MSAIVLEIDGAYIASCGECEWERNFRSETGAGRRATEHEAEHERWTSTQALLASLAKRKRVDPPHEHVHTWRCTDESCPGQGFPTRAELAAATKKRRAG